VILEGGRTISSHGHSMGIEFAERPGRKFVVDQTVNIKLCRIWWLEIYLQPTFRQLVLLIVLSKGWLKMLPSEESRRQKADALLRSGGGGFCWFASSSQVKNVL